MDTPTWPSEWLRGVIEICALQIVSEGPTHGYAVIRELEVRGLGTVKGGTLYPIMSRLDDLGYLSSSWIQGDGGPGKKIFAITAAGNRHLTAVATEWHEFSKTVNHALHANKGSKNVR